MIHISDIKRFINCPRLYLHSLNEEKKEYQPYLRSDVSIGELLFKYLNIEECFVGERNDPDERFTDNIFRYEWFNHPRLADGQLRINIPFIYRYGTSCNLYFVNYGTRIKHIDEVTYSISRQVVEKHGLNVKQIYVIYANENYIFDKEIETDKLFLITNRYKSNDIADYLKDNPFDYEEIINRMTSTVLSDYEPVKCRYCKLEGICDYYTDCFKDEEKLPDDSILHLVSSKYKNSMYERDIVHLKDADPEFLEGNRLQYAQIMASRNGGLFLDRGALKHFLKKVEHKNISFIDFEWDRYFIPQYKGMRPLDVVTFEYALYCYDDNGELVNRVFVGTGDCRKQFVESLIKNLPDSGPVFAYNADGAECLRLKELSKVYPEYEKQLNSIVERFVDLATPFIEGLVYDIRMCGNFTLKKLVSVVSDYSYSDLNISDGMKAVYSWREIDKNISMNEKEIIENLEKYCSLDAYGLFLVYEWLKKLVK